MMNVRKPAALAGAAALTAALALPAVGASAHAEDGARTQEGHRLTAVGVTKLNRLVEMDVLTGKQHSSTFIHGLSLFESVVGIDYRPSNERLYGVVRRPGGHARVVKINVHSGRIVSSVTVRDADGHKVRLHGSSFGVDFNPAADLLRVTSDADQNLRIDVRNGATTVDGELAYADGDPAAGRDPSIVGSAYTNGDQDPAGTTELYGLDSRRDTLVRQDPPNDGVLATIDEISRLNVTSATGFDVSTDSDVGVISVGGLLGTRLQVIDVEDGSPQLSRTLLLTWLTDIAIRPGQ